MKRKYLKKMCSFLAVCMTACSIIGTGIYAEETETEPVYAEELDTEPEEATEIVYTEDTETVYTEEETTYTEDAETVYTEEAETVYTEAVTETDADVIAVDEETTDIVDESGIVDMTYFAEIMTIDDTQDDNDGQEQYTLAFVYPDLTMQTYTLYAGQTILDACGGALPQAPAADAGKVFVGWLDNNTMSIIDGSETVSEDTTFGPKFGTCEHPEEYRETTITVPATCTEEGMQTVICQICNGVVEESAVPKAAHEPALVPAKEPTDTEAGNIAYYVCQNCGKLFADEACTTEITIEDTILEAGEYTIRFLYQGSSGVETIYTATAKAGQTIGAACGGALPTPPVKEGLVFAEWIEQDTYTAVSGDTIVKGDMDLAARYNICEHPAESVNTEIVTPATCVDAGKAVKTCQVCGKTWEEEIPATGVHSFGDWTVVKEATATEAGSEERTCSVCAAKETREISVIEEPTEPDETESTEPDTEEDTEEETEETEKDKDSAVQQTEAKTDTAASTGSTGAGTGSGSASATGSPNTGDHTNVFAWIAALLASAGCVLGVYRRKTRAK